MTRIDSIARQGIARIYEEDLESQKHFLHTISTVVREMENADLFFQASAFYVPNAEYLALYFGEDARNPEYDFYQWNGYCQWVNTVMFPIKDVVGDIRGFVGFDPHIKAMKREDSTVRENHYTYSKKDVFNRGKYLYMPDGVYSKAIEEEYILLVDGVFDMWSLHGCGFNVASLLGSNLSDEVLFQLSFIKNIYVLHDNDSAGLDLYTKLARKLPNVRYIRQNASKDADNIINSPYKEEYISGINKAIRLKVSTTLRLRTLKSLITDL